MKMMKVQLRGLGMFRDRIGEAWRPIELPERTTVCDLLEAVKHRLDENVAALLLEANTIIMVDGKRVHDFSTPLRESQEVTILKVAIGG